MSAALFLRRRARRGLVLIVLAVSSLALIGFAGLAIDVGFNQMLRTRLQAAADAAARAGALESAKGANFTTIQAAARQAAAFNGYTHDSGGVTVTVNVPPSTGDYASDNAAVEAIVSRPGSVILFTLFQVPAFFIRTRAAARPGADPICIFGMDPNDKDTILASGSSAIDVSCGIYSNSNHADALKTSGSACLSATSYQVVGGTRLSSSCPLSQPATTGVTPRPDPLAHLTPPPVGGCNYNNFKLDGVSSVMYPGVYCGGITIQKTNGRGTMMPGTYIILGAGLTVSGGAALTGDGVFIYNTHGPGRAYGNVDISGGGDLQLRAPTSGPYEGVLFFEDRTAPRQNHRISGNSTSVVEGSLYFPQGTLQFTGNSSLTKFTIMVAQKISFTGNASVSSDYSGLSTGAPIKNGAVVVE